MSYDQPHEKKGMMEKIKEKLPGGHKKEGYEQDQHTGMGTGMGTGYGTGTGAGYNTGMGTGYGTGATMVSEPYAGQQEGIPSGMRKTRRGKLKRQGSSSSSSSDEEGTGGQKKGLMTKIKEKLPGGHKDQDENREAGMQQGTYGTTGRMGTGAGTTGYGTTGMGTGTGYRGTGMGSGYDTGMGGTGMGTGMGHHHGRREGDYERRDQY